MNILHVVLGTRRPGLLQSTTCTLPLPTRKHTQSCFAVQLLGGQSGLPPAVVTALYAVAVGAPANLN